MRFHSLCGRGPAFLLGILLAIACSFVPLLAQDNPCDPHLAQLSDDPYGYRLRGDRCEGIYIREDAGNTTLLVASFTEHFEDFAPTSGKNLNIQWAALGDAVLRLRAQGLSHMLHYRMDSMRPPGNTSYIWPSNLLAVLRIRKQDIGVVGITSRLVGDTRREVYVPLSVGLQTGRVRSQNHELVRSEASCRERV